MATGPSSFADALEHHQAGRLDAAERGYRDILSVEPRHVDALHLLGVIAGQKGDHATAVDYIGRAIAIAPHNTDFLVNLGQAYRAIGKLGEAIDCFRSAISLAPGDPMAAQCLRECLAASSATSGATRGQHEIMCRAQESHQAGQIAEAERLYRQVLHAEPNHAEAHHLLGVVAGQLGDHVQALQHISRAIELAPNEPMFYVNLAVVQIRLKMFAEASASCRQAIALFPGDAEAHFNLGVALQSQGKLAEAAEAYHTTIELRPDHAGAYKNFGNVLRDRGLVPDSIPYYERALQFSPSDAGTHNNLGNSFKDLARLSEAVSCYRRAIALDPNLAMAHNNLGSTLKDQGRVVEAIECIRESLRIDPTYARSRDNLLYTLYYRQGITLAELAEAHEEFERQHGAPLRSAWRPHANTRDPERRLRLGFVSADLHQHPVGRFLVAVLEKLDPTQCETFCYNDQFISDAMTARIQSATTVWRDVAGMGDEALTECIHADAIDVLFDLTGHMARNRLLVFARKPSPIQVTWMGYVGGTGVRAMDYLLADRHLVPQCAEPYYLERILRMPDGFLCYDPLPDAPAVGPLPASRERFVTFGCFNNPAKINVEVLDAWAAILRRAPNSRLLLKFHGFTDDWVRQSMREAFSGRDVDPARIEMQGFSEHLESLAEYGRVDLALDPFPYNGGTTSCDALWMGVPVLTLPGETFAGRLGLTHLSNIGLPELIADSVEDYIERAVALAGNLPRLAALRAGLRERMAASPLCDARRFADNLLALLRAAWREWVAEHQDSRGAI